MNDKVKRAQIQDKVWHNSVEVESNDMEDQLIVSLVLDPVNTSGWISSFP